MPIEQVDVSALSGRRFAVAFTVRGGFSKFCNSFGVVAKRDRDDLDDYLGAAVAVDGYYYLIQTYLK
jgi:hypothetical protein